MSSNPIDQAVNLLKKGRLVAFPTETVYGLGADARNPEAIKKIFTAKQRPIDHPLIVHIGSVNELSDWAREIPPVVLQLARVFWPGPLTLILKKAPSISALVTGNQDTVGLRIPCHPIALSLLQRFGSGIAAPSANRFGKISPTTAAAVQEELNDSVDLILEGGDCDVGLESTILDLSGTTPAILRPGMITAKEIERVLQYPLEMRNKKSPRVSGSFEMHYAPETKLILLESEKLISYFEKITNPVAVVLHGKKFLSRFSQGHSPIKSKLICMPEDSEAYAHDLYRTLRELDHQHFSEILVETLPKNEDWAAITDRLQRASHNLVKPDK